MDEQEKVTDSPTYNAATPPLENAQKPQETKHKLNWKGFILALVIVGLLDWGALTVLHSENNQKLVPPTEPTTTQTKISPTTDPTADWKTYTNSTYNFSAKYPSQLSFEEEGFTNNAPVRGLNNTFTVIFKNKTKEKLDSFASIIMIRVFKKDVPISDVVNNYFGELSNDWKDITIGNTLGKTTTTLDKSGTVAYITKGDYIYYFHIRKIASDDSITELTFSQILSTFKFTENQITKPPAQ
jgi:hypothetical protein